MAKKIRFSLILSDGTQARSLDELKEHFDLESVLGHYKSGKLLTWLRDRYIETEADAIEALDENAPDFQQKLCEIFGVEFSGSGVDMEEVARRQERMAKLRQFTDEDEFIQNVDTVAFDQEELIDLLDEGCEKIYLCGEKFMVPASQKNKTYVGVNSPKVEISGKAGADWKEHNITFTKCEVEGLQRIALQVEKEQSKTLTCPDRGGMFENISIEVADKIYRRLDLPYGSRYLETDDYIVFEQCNGISAISKRTGGEFIVVDKSKIPSGGDQWCQWDKWIFHENTVFASWGEEPWKNHTVYKINIEEKTIVSLDFCVDVCQWATNGRYFITNDSGEVTCIDLEERKKYRLKYEVNGNGLLCTSDALYFETSYLDEKHDYKTALIKFSFSNKIEQIVTKLPSYMTIEAIALHNNKLFLLKLADYEDYYRKYELGYVDLQSDEPHYQCVCQSIPILNSSTIRKCSNGWFFVSKKADYPIEKLDFETLEFVTIAKECGYSEHNSSGLFGCGRGYWSYSANRIDKIGQWLYFKQGKKDDLTRVSLYQPMQVEVLRKEVEGVDL